MALRHLWIITAIRGNGDDHVLFVEGNWYANDFTSFTLPGTQTWCIHFIILVGRLQTEEIKWITDCRNAQNRPICCGEHGENSNGTLQKCVWNLWGQWNRLSWWPMKISKHLMTWPDAKFSIPATQTCDYLGGTSPPESNNCILTRSYNWPKTWKLENCTVQTKVLRSIFTQPGNRNTEPFNDHVVPGKLFTANYDMGHERLCIFRSGVGRCATDKSGNNTAWNNGWTFRNGNSVDIEPPLTRSRTGIPLDG